MAQKKYRVLRDTSLDGKDYKPDTVLLIDEKVGTEQKAAGAFDDSKASVEYAEGLGGKVITHKAPQAEGAGEQK